MSAVRELSRWWKLSGVDRRINFLAAPRFQQRVPSGRKRKAHLFICRPNARECSAKSSGENRRVVTYAVHEKNSMSIHLRSMKSMIGSPNKLGSAYARFENRETATQARQ